MKKRIYIYELDCYKVAAEEQSQRIRFSPERYFNLEGLPSEELAENPIVREKYLGRNFIFRRKKFD